MRGLGVKSPVPASCGTKDIPALQTCLQVKQPWVGF